MKEFERIAHTADLQIRAYGSTTKDLFRNALRGMFHTIEPISPLCRIENGQVVCSEYDVERTVSLEAPDQELLLIDFLSHALYLSDIHNEAYVDVTIDSLSDTKLTATLKGVTITGFLGPEIKAVTFHDFSIKNKNGRWHADIVFDI